MNSVLPVFQAVYLSPAQVRDLSHRTRHHPAPLKPVLAVLVRGADATGRLQQVVGLSDPQLAAETEPDSLHGRLAIRIGALLGPLVTGSKDAASARFEAAFFFGGRLFPCPAALPHPGSAVAQADVSTAILADIDQLWILAPGGTQQEMIAFLQVCSASLQACGS